MDVIYLTYLVFLKSFDGWFGYFVLQRPFIKKRNYENRTSQNILWPIKIFVKYFNVHQYVHSKIFHDHHKNLPASPPTYLMYGLLSSFWNTKVGTFTYEYLGVRIT